MKAMTGLHGRFKLTVRDGKTLEPVREIGWFDNLILNSGLNRLGVGGAADYCQVGSSNVAPDVNQTALVGYMAYANLAVLANGALATTPYYAWDRRTYRFGVGVAAGNISEVGVGWGTNSNLFCRALIVDGGGNPITITVLDTEVLDVTYELRVYLDLTDKNFNIVIGGVTHACILRPMNMGQSWQSGTHRTLEGIVRMDAYAYGGAIGAITAQPAGGIGGAPSEVMNSYSNNSYKRSGVATWPLANGNTAGGIDAVSFEGPGGPFQIGFVPPINKNATNELALTFEYTWARHVP